MDHFEKTEITNKFHHLLRSYKYMNITTYALARSVIVLGKLIRSHIPAIVLNALINVLSELLIVRRLEYLKIQQIDYGLKSMKFNLTE